MSTPHHLIGSINHFQQDAMYTQSSRQYPSPHHSPSLDMSKPVLHHGVRWGTGSPAPTYPMVSSTPVSWTYEKQQPHQQQRLPPSPPMMGDYSTNPYGSVDGDYQDHGLSMGPVQATPLSPPISEGFMSPDLTNQDPHQTWLHSYGVKPEASNLPLLDSSPLLGMNGYSSNEIATIQQTTPTTEGKRRTANEVYSDATGAQTQRKKRRLTEPGEANYHCQTCGKYFSRVWNYNAHRETHDPARLKPHACQFEDCGKSFVRRTDLVRHIQCVHKKDKKFKCSLCNGCFARKDTLRRHEDDGCPKRVDIQSRSNKSATPVAWTSWALRCPPPADYFSYSIPKQQHQNQAQNQTTLDNNASSFLPPLSIALSHGSQAQQQCGIPLSQ